MGNYDQGQGGTRTNDRLLGPLRFGLAVLILIGAAVLIVMLGHPA